MAGSATSEQHVLPPLVIIMLIAKGANWATPALQRIRRNLLTSSHNPTH